MADWPGWLTLAFIPAIGLIGAFIAKPITTTAPATTETILITVIASFCAIAFKAILTRGACWIEVGLAGGFASFSAVSFCALNPVSGFITLIGVVIIARDHHIAARHKGGLHRAQNAEIMFGVLEIVFPQHAVPGTISVTGELLVFFKDGLGRTTYLNVRSVRLIGAIGIVILWFLAWITSSTALALHHASPVCFLAKSAMSCHEQAVEPVSWFLRVKFLTKSEHVGFEYVGDCRTQR